MVEIAALDPALDPAHPAFHREQAGARHGRGQRLRSAHAAQARGQDPAAAKIAAVVLAAGLDEGLVGALDDALAADVDPGACGHLAVHHQAEAIELVEFFPARPVRHEVRVGDQHARRIGMGPEHAHGLARLHAERLVVAQALQRLGPARRSNASRAPRGRCRHRPPAPAGSPRPRHRDCSSACEAAPRSASSGRGAPCRAAR